MAATTPRIEQAGEERSARVESIRAVAALAVVVGHTFALSQVFQGLFGSVKNRLLVGGGLGVFLFFTLSGYLLFMPFLRAQVGMGRRVDLARYARNRALRILPLYYAVVAILLVVQPFDTDRGDWWRFALFIENFSRDTITRLDAPIWSLVVEMHFYVVLPLLAWVLALVARRSLAAVAAVLGALAAGSYFVRQEAIEHNNSLGPVLGRYALPAWFFMFASGMLLAVLRLADERRPFGWLRRPVLGWSTAWLAAGAGCLVLAAGLATLHAWLVAIGGFLFVGGAVLPLRPGAPARVLEWRPLAIVGIASYSLYLWHAPVLEGITGIHSEVRGGTIRIIGEPTDFTTMLAWGLPLTVAIALASYAIIERPFLRLRRRWASTGA